MLASLTGIEGVAQLAPGIHPAEVIALQDIEAVTLAQVLQAGRCDVATVLSLGAQLSRTLAEVHHAGVIHRDINPANILVSKTGAPMLIDFDLAVLAEVHMAVAQEGQIVGTLGYMAPEQTGRTGRAVDQRADLYALGACLYEMATGRPPFEGSDTLQLIHDHLVREPVAPSQLDAHVPHGLSDVILRLLAKVPERRFQSAEGLLHDLVRLGAEQRQGGAFHLGERDFPARLAPPQQLVGRDAELAMLRAAFDHALNTSRRTVLIEGAAGVGKSALTNELRPVVASAGGWFIHGKFDQYQRDTATAGALTQALRALGRLMLAQSRDELAMQRQRILDAVGRSASLITRLVPEFALLLGTQPEAPEIDPRQAELQVHQAALDLLGAIASAERPLVLVMDDLQWAGALPLRFFERAMGDPGLRGLLLVGALRTDEVDAGHVMAPMLAQWREQAQPPLHISLSNLTPEGMGTLIGQMLRLPPERANSLAGAVGALTCGNPFDTVEMINALRGDGILRLGEQGWGWDEAAIRHYVGRGNVVDLLAARIARLPADACELLEFMSCLGNAVECRLLGAATGLNEDDLRERLRAPLKDGLLVADQTGGQDSVQFRHDRVQQAVLGGMDEAQRAQRQLAMARRLAGDPAFVRDAAQQYLACTASLHQQGDRDEQRRAALLFHALAQKLSSTATYLLAERYLAAAAGLLAAIDDSADAALRRAIDAARHAALYSLGRLEESDPIYASMQACIADPLELVEPTCLQMRSLNMRGQMDQAKMLGLSLLRQLGLDAPPDYIAPDTEQRLDGLAAWVRQDSQLDHSKRVQIRDPRLLAIAKLLSRTGRSASVQLHTSVTMWLMLESQRLWAEHGPCPELVASLGRLGGMLISLREDFQTAFAITRHVLTVGESLGYEPQTSEARFIFVSYACHWFEPLEDVKRHVQLAYEGVLAGGDVSYAGYVHIVVSTTFLEIAPNLDAAAAEVEAGIALCQRTGNVHAAAQHTCERQLVRALRGQTRAADSFDDVQFNEHEFLATMGSLPYVELMYFARRELHALLLGDFRSLRQNAVSAMSRRSGSPGFHRVLHAHFLCAMARAWEVQSEASIDPAPLLAELDACRTWLAARAADQPYNFLHLLRLVEAEQAWALGDFWKAATSFDDAVAEANSRQRPWHRALITERAGVFQLTHGLGQTGRKLLADARDQYETWGATAKVAQMQAKHAFLQTRAPSHKESYRGSGASHPVAGSGGFSSDVLDLMGVLRASQALSSETSLDRLTARVSDVLAALSGATKVLLLSWNEAQWWLLRAAPGEASIPLGEATERGLLPRSVFAYAERTGEALIVDDAPGDDRFARDPYFARQTHCSLLLVPIATQGTTRAMVYLENREGRAAFNAQRLEAVMLIAGQLAVSLANAQLYESMEQRVHARTSELQETQAQLVTTARQAGKAEIANNVLHNVGNVLNSINVSASIVRRTIDNSRIEGLTRAVDLINEHQHDLPDFLSADPRGKALRPYLNELVGALRSERQDALGDLDRLTRSVDHITYVVATQQSHAGPSSVLEMAQPQELLDEALHLSADAIQRHHVRVLCQYGDVPASALDKQRLVQILVNLIANAAQAMGNVPEPSRRLTLGTSLVQSEGGERLRITVRDEGEGIAPENLTSIFAHGFTTRKSGHGFGLHSSALAAMEMGGKLTVQSDGPGLGAVFTLEMPINRTGLG
ncbi:MAG: ATP-binding region, ATPase domain protein [Ramlibacter sp.]|nr:ATP-binding region, ATPase domain protein [Ramlibacter sp.]